MTDNQKKVFDAWNDGKNIFTSGVAGSGKTFIFGARLLIMPKGLAKGKSDI